MRIATWNLAGRWDARHAELLDGLDCDLLLLTEVSERVELRDYQLHLGEALMMPRRRWAGIAARSGLAAEPDPHFASAAALVDGVRVVSSILPWRGCGDRWPGHNTHERTRLAVEEVELAKPQIWGGDFNHAFEGREYAGSKAGRADILSAVERLGLQVPTAAVPHKLAGLLTIDHIAVPTNWVVESAERVPAGVLSDHDAYVVSAEGQQAASSWYDDSSP